MNDFLQQPIPVAHWVDSLVEWLTDHLAGLFHLLQLVGQMIMDTMTTSLAAIPPLLLIVLISIAAFFIFNRKWTLPTFTFLGLLLIYNQAMWEDLVNTLALVLLSSLIAIVGGIPLGIVTAKNDKIQLVVKPILDVMQTMPSFVYLIPAVAFFGIGMVPGVFAAVIFALPPIVRLTNLGIRQVNGELKEASDSFGGTAWQKLVKLELPLAKGNIFAGINQTIMMVLSMVVVASMIGAPGLGQGVLAAVQRSQIGSGFVYGLSVVILAIIIDRFTQHLNHEKSPQKSRFSAKQKIGLGAVAVAAVIGITVVTNFTAKDNNKGTLTLAYAEQDDQVATTSVIAQVLEDQGYKVNMTSLDIPVTWEAVAKGQADAMLGAWLPTTHKANYAKFKNRLDNLGPSLDKKAQNGFTVPAYMKVDSIEDLTDEADKTLTAVEPGAGVTAAGKATVKAYPNLKGWKVTTSSAGAMTTQLERAIKNKEEIVVTGWKPHWMFSRYKLKFLKDPKKGMGGAESIVTMARRGLKKDQPEAYKILDRFQWDVDDIESVMLAIEKGKDPKKAAQDWIRKNPEKVAQWTK